MIILPSSGLGFISITKCASTTIEGTLKNHKGIIMGGTAGLKHMRYRHVEEFILPLLKIYRAQRPHFFAVVRHPAARMLSWYNFRTRDNITHARPNSRRASRYLGTMSLEEFVEQELDPSAKVDGPRVQTQLNYLVDAKGNIGVDTLIKIEHLDAMLPDFMRHFNVRMEAVPPRLNTSPQAVTGGMSEDLIKKIVTSDRFGPDLDLYHKGVESLPNGLPARPKRKTKAGKNND